MIKVNAKILNNKSRIEQIDNADYLVLNSVMLVEGVWNDVFYSNEVLNESVEFWNNKPVCIDHPESNGQQSLVDSPRMVAEFEIGRLFNASFKDGMLQAEIWLDIEKADKKSPEIFDYLNIGNPIGVSTGLSSRQDSTPGEYNGVKYQESITDIMPDHLAILLEKEPACNIKDKCGIFNSLKKMFNFSSKSKVESEITQIFKKFPDALDICTIEKKILNSDMMITPYSFDKGRVIFNKSIKYNESKGDGNMEELLKELKSLKDSMLTEDKVLDILNKKDSNEKRNAKVKDLTAIENCPLKEEDFKGMSDNAIKVFGEIFNSKKDDKGNVKNFKMNGQFKKQTNSKEAPASPSLADMLKKK